MAEMIYLGVDSKARKLKKAYIGVEGRAHAIKKIYVGVDHKAKQVYTSYTPVTGITLSWTIDSAYSKEGTIYPGPAHFTAAVSPKNATNKALTWSLVGNITGCETDGGYQVTPKGVGSFTLTISSADGPFAKVRIQTKNTMVSAGGSYGYCVVITSITKM